MNPSSFVNLYFDCSVSSAKGSPFPERATPQDFRCITSDSAGARGRWPLKEVDLNDLNGESLNHQFWYVLIGCSLINIYTPSILGYPHFLLPHMIPLRSHPLAGVCSAKSYALLPNCAPARDLSELPPGRLLPPRPSLRGIREGVHGRCWWDAKPQRKGKWMHKKKDA